MIRLWRVWIVAGLTGTLCGPAVADGAFFGKGAMSEPDQKALVTWRDGRETLILQVRYANASGDFGWVVPVPNRPKLGTAPSLLFVYLAHMARPRAVLAGKGALMGTQDLGGVTVEEHSLVGPYEVTVLAADDPDALAKWLKQHHFRMRVGASEVLESYVARRWHFVAYRISARKAQDEMLAQLRRSDPGIPSLGEAPMYIADRLLNAADRHDDRGLWKWALVAYNVISWAGELDWLDGRGLDQAVEEVKKTWSTGGNGPVAMTPEYAKARTALYTTAVQSLGEAIAPVLEGRGAGTIKPLKLEFDCSRPVYPLRISALNEGLTELDLYVLAPHRVRLVSTEGSNYERDVRTRFAGRLEPKRLPDELRSMVTARASYLTAFRGKLTPETMYYGGDLYLDDAPSDRAFTETVTEYGEVVTEVTSPWRDAGMLALGAGAVLLVRWLFIAEGGPSLRRRRRDRANAAS